MKTAYSLLFYDLQQSENKSQFTQRHRTFYQREDQLHPIISGNKFRKLKYNIQEAKKLGHATLLTFGGAYSNHILAVAGAGAEFGFSTIGIIRGEELESKNCGES